MSIEISDQYGQRKCDAYKIWKRERNRQSMTLIINIFSYDIILQKKKIAKY